MKYFVNCRTMDELKREFRRLAVIHHPDKGGSTETMQQISSDYDQMFIILKDRHNERAAADTTGKTKTTDEAPEEFREIIEKLIHMDSIVVEICGSWLWLSGNTFEYREELKKAGCKWASKKKMWYWHPEGEEVIGRGRKSMDEIRAKYGSQIFSGSPARIAANA